MAKEKAKPDVDIPAKLDSQPERELADSRIERQLTLTEERTTFEGLPFDSDVQEIVEAKAAALTIPRPRIKPGRAARTTRPLRGPAKKWLERFMVVAFRDFFEAIAKISEKEPEQRTVGAPPTSNLLYRDNLEHIAQTDIFPPKPDAHLDAATLKSMLIQRPKSIREDWLAARTAIQLECSPLSSFLRSYERNKAYRPSYYTHIARYAFRQALDLVDELRHSKSVENGPSRYSRARPGKQQEPSTPIADVATTPDLSLSERLAHVVLGTALADRILQLEQAREELSDLTTHRQEEIAASIEEFQDELNCFCDSFNRTFSDTEEATAVEQARAFSKDLNARLRILGYRLYDPDTSRAATLKAFPLRKSAVDVYFALYYSSDKIGEKRQTPASETIPPLFLARPR